MGNRKADIRDIAEAIRMKFERRQIPKEELARLYSRYNPQVDGNIFIKEAEKLFPKLNCGLATVYLQKVLGGEIVNGQFQNHNHTYLLLNGEVVDITADQYGGPEVYVGELKFPWARK